MRGGIGGRGGGRGGEGGRRGDAGDPGREGGGGGGGGGGRSTPNKQRRPRSFSQHQKLLLQRMPPSERPLCFTFAESTEEKETEVVVFATAFTSVDLPCKT